LEGGVNEGEWRGRYAVPANQALLVLNVGCSPPPPLPLAHTHFIATSFDEENDQEIMKFLSTAELTTDMFEPEITDKKRRSTSAVSEAEFKVQMGNYESRAYRAQEEKLKRLTQNKRQEFWKGLKKEHELLGVFSQSYRTMRTRSGSTEGRARMNSSAFGGSFRLRENSNGESTSMSSRTILQPGSGDMVGDRESMGEGGGEEGEEGHGYSAEVEEVVSIPHKATVLLCELLSFLAMAVFFYEKSESLLGKERWDEMDNSVQHTSLLLAENIVEGFVQVLLSFPVTIMLIRLFSKLDQKETAHALFETRVATDRARLLHGISQENPIDIRRSIYECEGLLRIVRRKERGGIFGTKGTKGNIEAVEYTLGLLKKQLGNIRRNQIEEDEKVLEGMMVGVTSEHHRRGLVRAFEKEALERKRVEDVLVRLCSLDPVRQALFLKDRRAMSVMKSHAKKKLYLWFIAEQGGYLPDGVTWRQKYVTETASGIYILFLTYYLYVYGVSQGKMTMLMAVLSFSLEVVISLLIVSPVFILVKFVLVPFVVAMVTKKNVKAAKESYSKKFGRRISQVGMKAVRRATRSPGMKGMAGAGAGAGVEMVELVMNPVRGREEEKKAGVAEEEAGEEAGGEEAAAGEEEVGDWVSHFAEDGSEYWEQLSTGVTTWERPEAWEGGKEDREDDQWKQVYDKTSGYDFYLNRRTGRSSWSEKHAKQY